MNEQVTAKTESAAFYLEDLADAIRHGMCVSRLSGALARELGLVEDDVAKVSLAAMVHDIGKLKVSPYIYGRKGKALKIEEMHYVRLHANFGAEIALEAGFDKATSDMILYHHENYDGSGYPFRMRGEEIPLGARIIRVCDVFVALISDRAYRKAFDPETALMMVIDEVRHFDMRIFLAFQRLINTTEILANLDAILHCEIRGEALEELLLEQE